MSASEKAEENNLITAVMDISERMTAMEQLMNTIPHERHSEEHEWLKMDIERRKAQRDFWIDVNKKLATTGILGAIGLLLSALMYAVTQWVTTH